MYIVPSFCKWKHAFVLPMKNIILSRLISIWNIFRLPYGTMMDLTAEHICLKKYIFYHTLQISL